MPLVVIVLVSAVLLTAAYFIYGPILSRLLRLRDDVPTPAVALRDDVDYVPIEPKFLLSQHFSAIAAAGPIVGPILAGIQFGWVPALLWILIGSILIGGVHDMTALVASIRHKARSIAEVVRDHMSRRAYLLFMAFVWLALVYIVVAFTDVTAGSFLGASALGDGTIIEGGAIATSSLLYLALPIAMGLLLRFTKLSLNVATVIFLPLVGLAIWGGQFAPFSVDRMFGAGEALPKLSAARAEVTKVLTAEQTALLNKRLLTDRDVAALANPKSPLVKALNLSETQQGQVQELVTPAATEYTRAMSNAQRTWNLGLLVYCVVASLVPMWLLLQPRGHLGGYFLYIALGGGMLGLILSGGTVQYEAFRGFTPLDPRSGRELSLFPLLFITIACGACSGFHSIIASGTTSKQLRRETDARVIGYGSMLLEAMVAIVSLCCVMKLVSSDPMIGKDANFLYASGIGSFLSVIGIPAAFGVTFGLMAFTTFVYDTLDVCTRLGRYILQELTGMTGNVGRVVATLITASAPGLFLFWQPGDQPLWLKFWPLFGASNQLLAALTLIGVTVWLWQTYKARWVLFVTGVPCLWMYAMSMWALVGFLKPLTTAGGMNDPVPWVAVILAALGVLIGVEAIRVMLSILPGGGSPRESEPAGVPA